MSPQNQALLYCDILSLVVMIHLLIQFQDLYIIWKKFETSNQNNCTQDIAIFDSSDLHVPLNFWISPYMDIINPIQEVESDHN